MSCGLVDVIQGAWSGGRALEDNGEVDLEGVITLQDHLGGFDVRSVVLIVWASLVGVGAPIPRTLVITCLQSVSRPLVPTSSVPAQNCSTPLSCAKVA